jgi:GntR family L-lactate dehydrogenase operon transcriptional regulator
VATRPTPGPRRTADLVGPLLGPSRSGNAFEESVERLLRLIKLGVVGVGERLPPERELATRMGVSRHTLRDALRALREAGYLESRRGQGGGTFVVARSGGSPVSTAPPPDPAAVEDALAVRYAVETGAAELAARRSLQAADRALLVRLEQRCCSASVPDYRPADSRLHLAVAALSGSPSLAAAVAEARARTNDLLDRIPLLPRNLEHSNHQHAQVVQAVLAGDAPGARAAMAEHLDGTAALLRAFLE